jgi:hypothetical protein
LPAADFGPQQLKEHEVMMTTKGRIAKAATLVAFSLVVTIFTVSAAARQQAAADCSTANVLSGSTFEIDVNANLKVDGTGDCIDWLADGTGSSLRTGVLAKADKPSGPTDDSFGMGTSEDNANPTIVTGSIPPNKSDLKVFGVYTEIGATSKFLELFWSRINSPQGTTNMDFELNQKFCDPTATPTNCANNGSGVTAETPLRTTGDKLITYDLSKGGTVPTISIRSWTGSAWGAATVISGPGGNAIGSVNTSAITAADSDGVGPLDPFTFGEAAINFSALFPPGTGCGTFGSAYLKSRASDSFTAELKDFIAPERVHLSNCTSISTTLSATSITVGDSAHDSAILTGATSGAGGTVTYTVYTDNACTLNPRDAGTKTVTNGVVPDSNTLQFNSVGTFYWQAVYSGDLNNAGSTSVCANEQLVVNKAKPSIGTTPNPSSGTVGVTLNDSATLTGGFNPTGTITFNLYGTTDSGCTGSPIYTQTVDVSVAATSPGYTTTQAGTYHWAATYSGDGNNEGASSSCAAEAVIVGKASPSITTSPSPAAGIIGDTLNDSATLSGGFNPTGTITFNLYGPADTACGGPPIYTQTVDVAVASTSPGFTTVDAGTYHWTATYNGDNNNNTASSACIDEAVVIGPVPTTISTAQTILPNDSATISASAGGTPTGTVHFSLYAPSDASCSGTPVFMQDVALSGGSAATSNTSFSISSATADTYRWKVVYDGDSKHSGVTSDCGTEQFTLSISNG